VPVRMRVAKATALKPEVKVSMRKRSKVRLIG